MSIMGMASDMFQSFKDLIAGEPKRYQSYQYRALSDVEDDRERRWERARLRVKYRWLVTLVIAMTLVFCTLLVFALARAIFASDPICSDGDRHYTCMPSVSQFWGQYSPFFPVSSEIDPSIPAGCTITFAQVLSRHGSRDPTAGKSDAYAALVSKIQSDTTRFGSGYEFLRDFKYTLGKDQLTRIGEQELVDSGSRFYERYGDLVRDNSPFWRASGQDRVVDSAGNFTWGFHDARMQDDRSGAEGDSFPYDILIIEEGDDVNNTLSHSLCLEFGSDSSRQVREGAKAEWADRFIPSIRERVNKNLQGAELTRDEIVYLMDLCPFTTVADPLGQITQFCDLFSESEWESYAYFQSLDKWYGYGRGNPLGPTQGVGFVNELISRLTGKPVEDRTSVNRTLDEDPETFPLGRGLYADFSHDNDMIGIYAAMGLFEETKDLKKGKRQGEEETKGFSAAWAVPFAARMYVEKMVCGKGEEEMVRVLLNERVVPLKGCGSDKLGRCGLDGFVESMGFARKGGDWDYCFA